MAAAAPGAAVQKPIAIVDTRHVLDEPAAGRDVIVRDEGAALDLLRHDHVEAVFVLADDYVASGHLRSISKRTPGLFAFADGLARGDRARDVIRRGLLGSTMPREVADRVVTPATEVRPFTIDRDGRPRPDSTSPLAILSGVHWRGR